MLTSPSIPPDPRCPCLGEDVAHFVQVAQGGSPLNDLVAEALDEAKRLVRIDAVGDSRCKGNLRVDHGHGSVGKGPDLFGQHAQHGQVD